MVKLKNLILILIIISVSFYLYIYLNREFQIKSEKKIPFVNLVFKDRVVCFDKNGDFLKSKEAFGLPKIDVRGDNIKKHYDSLKELSLVLPVIQEKLKNKHLKLILDIENDNLLLIGDKFEALIGRENIEKRIENVITLLNDKKIEGFIDASFDSIVVTGK